MVSPVDITERKRAEESLKVFRNLIDRSTDAIEVLEPGTLRFLDCNTAAHQTLGYTREEFLNLRAYDIDPLMDQAFATQLVDELDQAGHVIFESVHRRKDGSSFPVEINAKTVRLEKDYRLAVVRDITERKQAEERLLEYEKVVEGLEEMITVVDRDYRYLLANQAFLKHRSMEREQLLGCLVLDVLGQEVFETIVKPRLDECFNGKVVRYERTFSYPDLGERLLSVSYFPIEGPDGVDRAACVLHDITERRRTEMQVARNESQLAEAQNLAHIGSWNWDVVNDDLTWSAELFRIFGFPAEMPCLSLKAAAEDSVHPDDREFVKQSNERSIRNKEACSLSYRIIRPDGQQRFIHSRGSVVVDSEGNLLRTFGTAQDITERKQAEQAIDRAERKYRDIFGNASEGIFQSTPDGRFIAANPELARIYGFDSPEELIRSRADIVSEIYSDPARRQEFKSTLEKHGVVRDFEHQAQRKDGSRIWLTVNARVVSNEQGEVLYYEGTTQDINERKLAEARSAAFAALARKLSGAVTQLDAARIIADTASELFGWDSCNLDLYDADLDIVHPMLNIDTIAGRRVDITSAYTDRKPSARSHLVIDQGPQLTLREDPIEFDEGAIPFGDTLKPSASLMTVPVHHAARVVGLLSIQSYTPRAYDTVALGHLQSLADHCGAALDRIHAQEALRKSEERFRELFENAKDAYYVHDLNGKYISVNRAAERLCGYPRAEIIGKSFIDFIAADQLELVSENLCRKLIAEGETAYETELIAGDGSRVPIEVSSHLIYENGVAIGVQGIARDITARKQAEDALQRYPRQLIEAQEAERQRIARELHDQIGQVLTAVHLNLKAIWETCESASSKALIDEGVAMVDEAIGQVRDLSFELRPSLLDDLGLAAALRWYADRFAQRTGIRVITTIGLPELPKRLRRELETACFRIVQEALTNVARHAQARNVFLEVKRQNDEVRLFVTDDGHGFDVRDQNLAPFTTQVGLRGMRERALALNGRLEIESAPSRGTKICAHFPESRLERAAAAAQNNVRTI